MSYWPRIIEKGKIKKSVLVHKNEERREAGAGFTLSANSKEA